MPAHDSTARRTLRGIWNTALTIVDAIPSPAPTCKTCLDLGRNQRVPFRDPSEDRRANNYVKLSAYAKSAGDAKLNGCPYCALILLAVYLQADYLIREDQVVNVSFPVNKGVIISDAKLTRPDTFNLCIYTPRGTSCAYYFSRADGADFRSLGRIPPWQTL
jgi:hypothetical protein